MRFSYVIALVFLCLTGCEVTINLDADEKLRSEVITKAAVAFETDGSVVPPVVPGPGPTPKVARKDCTVCKGKGQIRTGDGISWTVCDNCEAPAAGLVVTVLPEAKRFKDKWGQIWWSRDGVSFYASKYCTGVAKVYPKPVTGQTQVAPATQFRSFSSGSCSTCR